MRYIFVRDKIRVNTGFNQERLLQDPGLVGASLTRLGEASAGIRHKLLGNVVTGKEKT